MSLTKEEKKKMKGLKLVSTPWDKKESVEISKNLDKVLTGLCKKFKVKKQVFIENAIVDKLQNKKCQIEGCPSIAHHIKEEIFEFIHRDINGKMKEIQLCALRTHLCDSHRESLEASHTSKVSIDTL